MRIVADPPTMRDAATTLDDSGIGFSETALRLGSTPLPEMPTWLATAPQDLLADAIPQLRSGAEESRLLATELRLRALVAEVGGSSNLNAALRRVETLDEEVKPFTASLDIADASGDIAGLLATKGILNATDAAGLAALENGASSAEAVTAWVSLEQQLSAFTDPVFATDLLAGGSKTTAVVTRVVDASRVGLFGERFAPILEGAGKFAGPVGMVLNGFVAIGPSQYANPVHDGLNRFFAGVGVVGFAMGPEGTPLVLIAAGFQLGNLVYDHWPAISSSIVTASRTTWHGLENADAKVGQLEVEGAQRAYQGASAVVGGVGHAAGTVADKGIDEAEKDYGEAKKIGKTVTHDLNPLNW